MFASQLADALEVLGRQFRRELPGGRPAAGLDDEQAVLRDQHGALLDIDGTERDSTRFRPEGHPAVQSWVRGPRGPAPVVSNKTDAGDCGRIQDTTVAGYVHERQHDPAPALARGAGLPGVRAGDGRSRVAGQRRNGADQAQIRFEPPVNVGLFGSGLKSPFNLHVHPFPGPDRRADQPNARHGRLASAGRLFVLAEDGDHFRGGTSPVPAADHGRNLRDADMVVGPSPAVGRDLGLAQDLIVAPTKPAERRGIHPNLDGVGRGNCPGRPANTVPRDSPPVAPTTTAPRAIDLAVSGATA